MEGSSMAKIVGVHLQPVPKLKIQLRNYILFNN